MSANPFRGIGELIDNAPWQAAKSTPWVSLENLGALFKQLCEPTLMRPEVRMVHPAHGAWMERTGKMWHEWYKLGRFERYQEIKRWYASTGVHWMPEASK